jgi:hypothetical protein
MWRNGMFLSGLILLIASVVYLTVIELWFVRLGLASSVSRRAICLEIGAAISFTAFVLVFFGNGWKRWLFALCAFLELYFFLSGILLLVQTS